MYNRVRYLRNKEAKTTKNHTESDENIDESEQEMAENENSVEDVVNDALLWLKTTKVDQSNERSFMEKLDITRRARIEMVQDKTIDLLKLFPFFFVRPQLVN